MARWIIYALLLCAIASPVHSDQQGPVLVLMEPARHLIVPGEQMTLKVFVKNTAPAARVITFLATASYTGDGGIPHDITSTLDLNVNGKVHVGRVILTVPPPLTYVPNTAIFNNKPLPAMAIGKSLTVTLDTDLTEQSSLLLTIDVTRPK